LTSERQRRGRGKVQEIRLLEWKIGKVREGENKRVNVRVNVELQGTRVIGSVGTSIGTSDGVGDESRTELR